MATVGLSRIVVLVASVALVSRLGYEPSRDVQYHAFLSEVPGRHLTHPFLPQYPPFLAFAESLTYRPWRWLGFSPATSVRAGMVVWDLVTAWLVFATVAATRPERLRLTGLAYTLLPLTSFTSAVFGQDEVIGAAFVAATLLAVALDRRRVAWVLAVAGLFVAKLLLAPLLVALVLIEPTRDARLRAAAWMAGMTGAVMAVLAVTTGRNGITNQTGYKPDWITFSVSPWSWAVERGKVAIDNAQSISLVLALVLAAGVLALLLRRPAGEPLEDVARTTAALLLAAFAALAVVNPEYVTLAVPALLLLVRRPRDLLWATAVTLVPWASDTAFAVIRKSTARGWPIVGDVHPGTSGFDLLDHTRIWLSFASSVLFLVLAVVVARGSRRPDASAA